MRRFLYAELRAPRTAMVEPAMAGAARLEVTKAAVAATASLLARIPDQIGRKRAEVEGPRTMSAEVEGPRTMRPSAVQVTSVRDAAARPVAGARLRDLAGARRQLAPGVGGGTGRLAEAGAGKPERVRSDRRQANPGRGGH